MAKFIVTLVVETDSAKKAPTKRMLKEAIQGVLLYSWVEITDSTKSVGEMTEITKVRVRSVDFD